MASGCDQWSAAMEGVDPPSFTSSLLFSAKQVSSGHAEEANGLQNRPELEF